MTDAPAIQDLQGLKAGWKTSEFWVTLAAYVAGVVLLVKGQDLPAGIVFGVASGGYSHARGLAKQGGAA